MPSHNKQENFPDFHIEPVLAWGETSPQFLEYHEKDYFTLIPSD